MLYLETSDIPRLPIDNLHPVFKEWLERQVRKVILIDDEKERGSFLEEVREDIRHNILERPDLFGFKPDSPAKTIDQYATFVSFFLMIELFKLAADLDEKMANSGNA